ncbi:hypothetical protein P22_2955 [Propionispora sp. 2/2-37]|uniref:hypothetical protein n=1 Tax=Propionispora sp. 2/2-37 TaxID=1677858 RepID=UPI0006BEDD86|nr:hypothetical protein [Propionispora sp. 2/2-37]CUH96844.1 hypothetical protein P22_2955 [Propionispora sp. 2/2-37]
MNKLAKKVIVYSLVGIMQFGFGASVIEASPRDHHDWQAHHRYDKDREQRIREENRRHEREMRRRHHESEREWRERQQREKEHHEEIMRTLGGLAILGIILSNN